MAEESTIEKWLGEQLKKRNCLWLKWISPGNAGVPDRILITPRGQVLIVELKASDGRLSKRQREQIERLRKHGCDVFVIYGKWDAEVFMQQIDLILSHEVDDSWLDDIVEGK